MLINSRKDLDNAPADDRTRFMAQLGGTIHKWRWNDTEWDQYADTSTIERFGFTLADFPDAPVPPMPEMSPEEKEAERDREEMAGMSITSRQGEQQLILAGLDEQVEAAIDGIEDVTQRKLTRAWYQRASTWDRDSAALAALADALGLTDAQVDDLFRSAAEL